MTMPSIAGDKLAIEIMKIRPDIQVIICTGFSERITEQEAKALGSGLVEKCFICSTFTNIFRHNQNTP